MEFRDGDYLSMGAEDSDILEMDMSGIEHFKKSSSRSPDQAPDDPFSTFVLSMVIAQGRLVWESTVLVPL